MLCRQHRPKMMNAKSWINNFGRQLSAIMQFYKLSTNSISVLGRYADMMPRCKSEFF